MNSPVYRHIYDHYLRTEKLLALLIDPDKYSNESLIKTMGVANKCPIGMVFIGGSLLVDNRVEDCIKIVKEHSGFPVVLFPGSPAQINKEADAILLLSLISGRNPELLIGRHVEAAPALKKSGLEILPTGYMLIDSGMPTTASYISGSFPIPHNKPDIAACTAMAGEMLGLRLIYMDGGSGAAKPISTEMIAMVKENINVPLIIGGGLRSKEAIINACQAGADVVVVGNIIEENPEMLYELSYAINAPA